MFTPIAVQRIKLTRLTSFGLLVAVMLTMSACKSEPEAPPQLASGEMTDAERAYLEFRASHAGVEIPSRVEPPVEEKKPEVVKPVPVPATEPQPVVTSPAPEPKPKQPKKTQVARLVKPKPVAKPVRPIRPKPVVKPRPAVQPRPVAASKPVERPNLQSNVPPAVRMQPVNPATTLSASDGVAGGHRSLLTPIDVLEGRTTSTASGLGRKPASPVAGAHSSVVQSAIGTAIDKASIPDAVAVVTNASKHSLAQVADALRVMAAGSPVGGDQPTYRLATASNVQALRVLAADALLKGYPHARDKWARQLLSDTSQPGAVRAAFATRVIAHGVISQYNKAISVLASDRSGRSLFAARREIIAAGPSIIRPLVGAAVAYRNTRSMFVARRLFRWIENRGKMDEARRDTFEKSPSAIGIVMFEERFGKQGLKVLKSESKVLPTQLRQAAADAINRIESGQTFNDLPKGTNRLYLLTYESEGAIVRLLTDKTLMAGQSTRQTVRWADGSSRLSQQAVAFAAAEIAKMRTWKADWPAGLTVAGHVVDLIDLQ